MAKTITTYYCDRCGKEMEENIYFCCSTHPSTAIKILLGEWEYANLCDKCKKSFKAWWEKPFASQTKAESEETE